MTGRPIGASPFFIILTIMGASNTAKENHIFPLFLKEVAVELTESDDGAIPVTTSHVMFDIGAGSSNAFTLADGTIPGQVLCMYAEDADGTHKAVITVANYVFAENKIITINADGEGITLIWLGDVWAPFAVGGATTAAS